MDRLDYYDGEDGEEIIEKIVTSSKINIFEVKKCGKNCLICQWEN